MAVTADLCKPGCSCANPPRPFAAAPYLAHKSCFNTDPMSANTTLRSIHENRRRKTTKQKQKMRWCCEDAWCMKCGADPAQPTSIHRPTTPQQHQQHQHTQPTHNTSNTQPQHNNTHQHTPTHKTIWGGSIRPPWPSRKGTPSRQKWTPDKRPNLGWSISNLS